MWKEQHLNFFYMGRTSRYSCGGLRDKVRAMLLDLGARRDLTVTALGCEEPDSRVRLGSAGPSLNIVFFAPALPDARAKASRPGDWAAVDAQFESFTIANDVFRNMGVADCELVQEFARQILPRLVVRDLKQDITVRAVPAERRPVSGAGRDIEELAAALESLGRPRRRTCTGVASGSSNRNAVRRRPRRNPCRGR